MNALTLSLFAAEELGPVNENAERRRNRNGKPIKFQQPKNGRYHKCDDRCTHAKGSECSCACMGTNHGIYAV